ncbi:MAG: CoB--CoM heterodisulfide reductase iron-sulfur subunit B family protein [Planctomycetota bacterium]|nr:CoB--CoM heterodisulfide reductase iron-sulfur subunit B family protein [Planctomycetota bacterium]
MKIAYYPGCTLKTKGLAFEISALAVLKKLDWEVAELPRWNCCGTVYSLAGDDLIHQVAPIRNLIRVKETGARRVLTLCSFCYHTLKRANAFFKADEQKRQRLSNYLDDESVGYEGEVETIHLLTLLKDEIGFETLRAKVARPLAGLRVVPYYGCTLLRPAEVAIDDPERPTIMESLLRALGADVADDPYRTECCGSFQTVSNPEFVLEASKNILASAARRKADLIALSCPLCDFNLGRRQFDIATREPGFNKIPTVYFSQLLALALGLGEKECAWEHNYIDPRPALGARGLTIDH